MIQMRVKKKMRTALGEGQIAIDLKIDQGQLVTVFGPSGAGKTTILRMLAGLSVPDEGYIAVDGEVWFDSTKKYSLAIQQRNVGFVFQEHNLFPHMTIRGNLNYAARPKAHQSIDQWMDVLDLKNLQNQKPSSLSSGQRQRVALARALIGAPKLLLMDEPLSDLDMSMRVKLQDVILSIHQQTRLTIIFVSHDISEVFKLSSHIFVLKEGKITRSGLAHEIFEADHLSGKFKFTGTILEIKKDGVVYIVTIAIGQNITKVVVTDEEILGLSVGSSVLVATKAFNPILLKYEGA